MHVLSSASARVSGGRMEGIRCASMVFPQMEHKGHVLVPEAKSVQVMKTLEVHEPRAERGSGWATRVQPEAPLCVCGCGERVTLRAQHRSKGVPRYVHGHHPNPIRRGY